MEQVKEIEGELIENIIEYLNKAHWRRLETIVVELLTTMGYGDGEVTGKTNDGGFDGIIKEDRLGLDNIYVQAKRWGKPVGSPDVQGFAGALIGKGARKGIFITTSSFTKSARDFADKLESMKIILIDGTQLAKLMIENNIGVSSKKKLIIKEVDFSYFEGE
ncbi:restriction endonuclease [Cytobacillus oceanisediminis]|uniref:restriction endonuclease n=1 Tax=Cytobacillus oceanisediminis TaxID=665099 RepID=UPI001FB33512|nr:restriction endonuclease [Cytobacillus oceanisediminis]UOE57305.1 restriction endonuclease [Cytobacillus oceanisediminis]